MNLSELGEYKHKVAALLAQDDTIINLLLGPVDDELLAVEVKKFCGVGLVEGVGEHRLGRVLEFLVVEPVHRAKIWDAAFR